MKKNILLVIIFFIIMGWAFFWWNRTHTINEIIIIDDGEKNIIKNVKQGTICNVLQKVNINLKNYDKISPNCENHVKNNLEIVIKRRKKVFLKRAEKVTEIEIFGKKKLRDIFLEHNIKYDDDDIITKELDFLVDKDINVEIIDVKKEILTEKQEIKFKKEIKKDNTKEIGYKKITKVGILGEQETIYNVTFHNKKEFKRELKSQQITKKPVNQIVTIGTKKVYKLGKSHNGQASWYTYKGCDCAANQWLPIGSKVKVTNKANGKSVVVKINDRGPFADNRIIDLDKKAFQKIASLKSGVINIKMEEIEE